MFFVTGAYHRYFSHRSYKTSRWFQFVLALGATFTGKRPLWWAAHHRVHHKYSDLPGDLHSAKRDGFCWSHMGWILARDLEGTDLSRIKGLLEVPRAALARSLLDAAARCGRRARVRVWRLLRPRVGVRRPAGACAGTARSRSTRCPTSGAVGRYATEDDSRNNLVLALITMGEGWHNNHHHYQVAHGKASSGGRSIARTTCSRVGGGRADLGPPRRPPPTSRRTPPTKTNRRLWPTWHSPPVRFPPATLQLRRAQLILMLVALLPTVAMSIVGVLLLVLGSGSTHSIVAGILVLAFCTSGITGYILGSVYLGKGASLRLRVQNDFVSAVLARAPHAGHIDPPVARIAARRPARR
jgi:hypothetical protein